MPVVSLVQAHMNLGPQMEPWDLMCNPNPFPSPSTLWLCCAVCLRSSAGSFHHNSRFCKKPRLEKSLWRASTSCLIDSPEQIAVAWERGGSDCPGLNHMFTVELEGDASLSWRHSKWEWQRGLPQRKLRVSCYPRKEVWMLSNCLQAPNSLFFKETCPWIHSMQTYIQIAWARSTIMEQVLPDASSGEIKRNAKHILSGYWVCHRCLRGHSRKGSVDIELKVK